MNEGWKCPQCGKINAPWVQSCNHVLATGPTEPYKPQEVARRQSIDIVPNWGGQLPQSNPMVIPPTGPDAIPPFSVGDKPPDQVPEITW
jgi:hypothetical protein